MSCHISEAELASSKKNASLTDWKQALHPGAVIEVWSQGHLCFALVSSLYEKGVVANFIRVSSGEASVAPASKISFGEIISVWHHNITPTGPQAAVILAKDVEVGLNFLKNAMPRALDLSPLYLDLRRIPKSDPRAAQSASNISRHLFPMGPNASRSRRAAGTVACAILLATDNIRFKRAAPGMGWRALPPSVATARGRTSFVDMCKEVLEHPSSSSLKRQPTWTREQLEILRDIEIVAASGTAAHGTPATALEALGYELTDDGAAKLLLDIGYWATGSVQKHGGGTTQAKDEKRMSSILNLNLKNAEEENNMQISSSSKQDSNSTQDKVANDVRDWTFSPAILDEARELRDATRKKRMMLLKKRTGGQNRFRRNLFQPSKGDAVQVYCIDDKNSRFLDDALSVQVIEGGSVIRAALHITDVDQVVRHGSPIDDLARERGQSLYLPLKPLHMLPASAMDAASFSSTFPAEAITVMVDFDYENDVIRDWEVFASIIPPVKRLNYEQFDLALEKGAEAAQITEEQCEDLRQIARVAPLLAEKLDRRKGGRKQKSANRWLETYDDYESEARKDKSVASVRLVKKIDSISSKSRKVAQVIDFQTTGSHCAVGDMLTSAGSLIRQFAKENRAYLPENQGAFAYVSRCGTAPLRRYADLAIQRQIKCILFGRPPAGRRRMEDLRSWLTKRHAAAERIVAEKRRSALHDSLSDHCAQQCLVSGSEYAVLRGQVRGVSISKKGILHVDVNLNGTGLCTSATVSGQLLEQIVEKSGTKDSNNRGQKLNMTKKEAILACAKDVLQPRSRVRVQILNVNTMSQEIEATVIKAL